MSAICRPDTYLARLVERCPFCKRRRRVVAHLFEWYDPFTTCCACGNQWGAGAPRRTRSKVRLARSAECARVDWKAAGTMWQAIEALVDAAFPDEPKQAKKRARRGPGRRTK